MKSAAAKLGSLVRGSFKGIRVLKRGVSPRIMAAEVVGSRGVTPVDGATLRARLGLFDTWAYFTSISSKATTPTSPSGGAQAPRPFAMAARAPVGALTGTVIADASRATVQVRRGGAWVDAGTVRLGRSGRYRFNATARGAYRVVVDGAVGPVVQL